MVNIWMVMKECGEVLDLVNARAAHLRLTPVLTLTMQRIEENAQRAMVVSNKRTRWRVGEEIGVA